MKINLKKILYTIFYRSKNKFDWSKMLQLIQHQSSTDQNRQRLTNIFNHNFDRSKFWKKQFFEKQSEIMQKLLKALNFMNHMHEYKMKCFSKTYVLNPIFPKLRFSIQSLKISTIKCVLHKTQGIFQTWLVKPETHTITCTKFSKE